MRDKIIRGLETAHKGFALWDGYQHYAETVLGAISEIRRLREELSDTKHERDLAVSALSAQVAEQAAEIERLRAELHNERFERMMTQWQSGSIVSQTRPGEWYHDCTSDSEEAIEWLCKEGYWEEHDGLWRKTDKPTPWDLTKEPTP